MIKEHDTVGVPIRRYLNYHVHPSIWRNRIEMYKRHIKTAKLYVCFRNFGGAKCNRNRFYFNDNDRVKSEKRY